MKVTETIMQGIKTTESINTEMILTCRLITITYTHNNMLNNDPIIQLRKSYLDGSDA